MKSTLIASLLLLALTMLAAPARKFTALYDATGLEIEEGADGAYTVTGFTGEPQRLRGFTRAAIDMPAAAEGDFTATLDLAWDLLDNAFMGEVLLQALDANGGILAECGIYDSWIAYPARGLGFIGPQRPKNFRPVQGVPLKYEGAVSITRRGDKYTLRLSTLVLAEGVGATAPVAALRILFQRLNYKGNAKLPPSHFGRFTVKSLKLAGPAGQSPAQAALQRKSWTVGEPIIWYWAGPDMSDEFAAELAAGGWNTAFGRNVFDLDIMQRHGLRGVLWMPCNPDTPENVAQLKQWLASVRNHPALYGVSCGDEPGYGERMLKAQARVDFMRENAPEVLHFNNMYPYGASNAQLGHFGPPTKAYLAHIDEYFRRLHPQLLSYDHYTFFKEGDRGTYFNNQAIIRRTALKHGIPSMNIVQGCAWTAALRVPTPEEYRYLAFTSLAYGSQGLSCYVYSYRGHWGSMRDPVTKKTGPLYEAAKTINRDFKAIARELQPLRSLRAAHAGEIPFGVDALDDKCQFQLSPALANRSQGLSEPLGPGAEGDNFFNLRPPVKGFLLGVFGQDAAHATHVLVVNLDYKNAAATTLAAPHPLERFDPATRAWSAVGGARAKLEIPAGGGVLLRLAGARTCQAGPENELGRTMAPPSKPHSKVRGGFSEKFFTATLPSQWSADYKVKCDGLRYAVRPGEGLVLSGLRNPQGADALATLERTMPPANDKFYCDIPLDIPAALDPATEITFSLAAPNGELLAAVTIANGKVQGRRGHTGKTLADTPQPIACPVHAALVIQRKGDQCTIKFAGNPVFTAKCDTAPVATFRISFKGPDGTVVIRTILLG